MCLQCFLASMTQKDMLSNNTIHTSIFVLTLNSCCGPWRRLLWQVDVILLFHIHSSACLTYFVPVSPLQQHTFYSFASSSVTYATTPQHKCMGSFIGKTCWGVFFFFCTQTGVEAADFDGLASLYSSCWLLLKNPRQTVTLWDLWWRLFNTNCAFLSATYSLCVFTF